MLPSDWPSWSIVVASTAEKGCLSPSGLQAPRGAASQMRPGDQDAPRREQRNVRIIVPMQRTLCMHRQSSRSQHRMQQASLAALRAPASGGQPDAGGTRKPSPSCLFAEAQPRAGVRGGVRGGSGCGFQLLLPTAAIASLLQPRTDASCRDSDTALVTREWFRVPLSKQPAPADFMVTSSSCIQHADAVMHPRMPPCRHAGRIGTRCAARRVLFSPAGCDFTPRAAHRVLPSPAGRPRRLAAGLTTRLPRPPPARRRRRRRSGTRPAAYSRHCHRGCLRRERRTSVHRLHVSPPDWRGCACRVLQPLSGAGARRDAAVTIRAAAPLPLQCGSCSRLLSAGKWRDNSVPVRTRGG